MLIGLRFVQFSALKFDKTPHETHYEKKKQEFKSNLKFSDFTIANFFQHIGAVGQYNNNGKYQQFFFFN